MGELIEREKTAVGQASQEYVALQTMGGRMHVRWDHEAQATPHGQIVYFAEFVATAGIFDNWVKACPLHYTSPNASRVRDVLGTLMLGVLSGSKLYAHLAGIVFVDLRDPRELEREGRIPNAFHCPRGMLEFWIDPSSPYHKPILGENKKFFFYCASGWRSALTAKAAQDMGLEDVSHLRGVTSWKEAGGEVAASSPKHPYASPQEG